MPKVDLSLSADKGNRLQVSGIKELSKKLSELGEKLGGRQLRSAVVFSLTPLVAAAKQRAPVGTKDHTAYNGIDLSAGYLSRHIIKKAFMSKDKTFVSGSVGPSREAFYGSQFVELGTENMTADPWLEPAYRATKDAVFDRFKAKLKANIDKVSK